MSKDLIEEYLRGTDLLRKAVAGMPRSQLEARPVAGKWSTLEVVCHITDFEPIYADRMKRVIALENPSLLGADENDFARRLAYHQRDLEEELAVMDITRKQMARILQTLAPSDFQRTGVHSERGLLTLEKLVKSITNHIPHHIKFIEEKRHALGV